jgi:hypothetical protein
LSTYHCLIILPDQTLRHADGRHDSSIFLILRFISLWPPYQQFIITVRTLSIYIAMEYIIRGKETILFNMFLVISSCLELEFLPTRFNFEFRKSISLISPDIAFSLWLCWFLVPIFSFRKRSYSFKDITELVPPAMNSSNLRCRRLAISTGPNCVGFTWRWRQNPVSETLCYERERGRHFR